MTTINNPSPQDKKGYGLRRLKTYIKLEVTICQLCYQSNNHVFNLKQPQNR